MKVRRAHFFTDELTYCRRNRVGMVETRAELMTATVSGRRAKAYHHADSTLGPVLRQGGFNGRWVHFDFFLGPIDSRPRLFVVSKQSLNAHARVPPSRSRSSRVRTSELTVIFGISIRRSDRKPIIGIN